MPSGVAVDESQRVAMTANMNLAALRRQDPCVVSILCSSTHVAVYELPIEGADAGQWQRRDIEGPLFVVFRKDDSGGAAHRVMVTNRKSPQNFVNDITPGAMNFETADRMIMFQDAKGLVSGLWFYVQEDLQRVFDFMTAIANGAELPTAPEAVMESIVPASAARLGPGQREAQKRKPKSGRQGQVSDRVQEEQNRAEPSPAVAREAGAKAEKKAANVKRAGAGSTKEVSASQSRNPTASPQTGQGIGKREDIEDNLIQRFFPNVKLTNGVAGVSPPAELTKGPDIENDMQRDVSRGVLNSPPSKEGDGNEESEVAESGGEKSSVVTSVDKGRGLPSQHEKRQQHADAEEEGRTMVPGETAAGGFMPSTQGLLSFPPLHMSHGMAMSAQHGMHPAHYQHALQSKITMLQNQMMALAVRKQQLAAQQQQLQQNGGGPAAQGAAPSQEQVEMRLILNQQMQLQQTIGQLQQQMAHQHLAQQQQQQQQKQQQQQQLAMAHGHLGGPPGGGGLGMPVGGLMSAGAMGHVVPSLNVVVSGGMARPPRAGGGGGGMMHSVADGGNGRDGGSLGAAAAADGRSAVHPSAPASSGGGGGGGGGGGSLRSNSGSSNAMPEWGARNVGRVGSAIAATALEADPRAAMDRAHFRGMLQRLLTDRKLFDRAYAHYCG